jgi:hypothetical protein
VLLAELLYRVGDEAAVACGLAARLLQLLTAATRAMITPAWIGPRTRVVAVPGARETVLCPPLTAA